MKHSHSQRSFLGQRVAQNSLDRSKKWVGGQTNQKQISYTSCSCSGTESESESLFTHQSADHVNFLTTTEAESTSSPPPGLMVTSLFLSKKMQKVLLLLFIFPPVSSSSLSSSQCPICQSGFSVNYPLSFNTFYNYSLYFYLYLVQHIPSFLSLFRLLSLEQDEPVCLVSSTGKF